MKEVTVQELKEKIENDDDFFLLDVREMSEYLVSNLDGEHIPLGELDARIKEIEDKKDQEVIIMCRSGNRSGRACQFLGGKGFNNVANLRGGITAWAKEIDPSIPVA
jgi:adenylyltransferase/sulfurtransferase